MYLEIITPDESVFEGEVDSAIFPGSDGSFQILNDHAPLVSSVGKGDVKIVRQQENKPEEIHFSIDGGVVEVLNNKILVLAESIGE
ncbi:MAG: ATP synthase F1 subunit epsilon [Reichenbachiella sp.]|uniref:ATP synthase F1 subunit epsilon n=1 Tax=Reichenbachiella sp. TaxID=2184521 RepID=UPI0032654C6B